MLTLIEGGHSISQNFTGVYIFGFNGQEKDDEVAGAGNLYTADYWEYDARLGRRWNIDPVVLEWQSGYACLNNNPIFLIDPYGNSAGDYYTEDGKYLGNDGIDDDKVYTVKEGSYGSTDPEGNTVLLTDGITELKNKDGTSASHKEFLKRAATIYGESSAFKASVSTDDLKKEIFALAYVYSRNQTAFGENSAQTNSFRSTDIEDRNGTRMQLANAAMINFYTGGTDYSYGATNWDGGEQALFGADDKRFSNGSFELHKNTLGWKISDEHYAKWKSNVGARFKAPQISYTPAKKQSTDRKYRFWIPNSISLHSTAVYGNTIFWKKQ